MEYLLVVYEYFRTRTFRHFVAQLLIPIIIGVFMYQYIDEKKFNTIVLSTNKELVTILGILLGFTISIFTVLLTSDNKNIDLAKQSYVKNIRLYQKKVSLHRYSLINLGYLIIVESIFIVTGLIFHWAKIPFPFLEKLFICIFFSSVVHVVAVILRTFLDIYFILSRSDD
jgi:hypothetical protein